MTRPSENEIVNVRLWNYRYDGAAPWEDKYVGGAANHRTAIFKKFTKSVRESKKFVRLIITSDNMKYDVNNKKIINCPIGIIFHCDEIVLKEFGKPDKLYKSRWEVI